MLLRFTYGGTMAEPYKRAVLLEEPEKVAALRSRIADMMRASDDTQEYFVEPQDGVLSQVLSRRHHFIFGRRGSGKSSLLLQGRTEALKRGRMVAMVNLSKFGHESLSHALLETMRAILSDVQRLLTRAGDSTFNARIDSERQKIVKLLDEPEIAQAQLKRSSGSSSEGEGRAGVDIPIIMKAGVRGTAGQSQGTEETKSFEERKLDKVNRIIRSFEQLAGDIAAQFGGLYLLLDDLYYLRPSEQPEYLHYLAAICSNHPIWIKAGGVKQRTRTYAINNGRPVGLDLTNDASEINLDSSLEQYAVTEAFLEKLLRSAIGPFGIAQEDLLSPKALDRMIQASGGVARDFLTVLDQSIEQAKERMLRERHAGVSSAGRAVNQRIVAKDIWEASANLNEKKKVALRGDVEDREAMVFEALGRVTKFVSEGDRVNSILLEGPDNFWSNEGLLKLWEFKLLHIIHRSRRLRGKDYAVAMLDVGELAHNPADWRRACDLMEEKAHDRIERPMQVFCAASAAPSS